MNMSKLERLERDGLFYPALRIRPVEIGSGPSGRTRFIFGIVDSSRPGWIRRYKLAGLVARPVAMKFRPWKQYDVPEKLREKRVKAKAELRHYWRNYYARSQILPLWITLNGLRFIRQLDDYLEGSKWTLESQRKIRGEITSYVGQRKTRIAKRVALVNRVIEIGYSMETVHEYRSRIWMRSFWESVATNPKGPVAQAESYADEQTNIVVRRQRLGPVKAILRKWHCNESQIIKWRKWLIKLGKSQDPTLGWPQDIFKILPRFPERAPQGYFISRVCYRLSFPLYWILRVLGKKPQRMHHLLGVPTKELDCVICGKVYTPIKKTQHTCGDKECMRRHKNHLKQQMRKRIKKLVP